MIWYISTVLLSSEGSSKQLFGNETKDIIERHTLFENIS